MAVLEILAAANASISIIKTSIGHGKDMASMAKHFGTLLGAEEDLKKAAEKKKNSFRAQLMGGTDEDFEEFAQLEKLRENKRQLEQYMRLMCPSGTYDRYVKHMAEARKARREAERKAAQAREELIEGLLIAGLLILLGSLIFAGIYLWKFAK